MGRLFTLHHLSSCVSTFVTHPHRSDGVASKQKVEGSGPAMDRSRFLFMSKMLSNCVSCGDIASFRVTCEDCVSTSYERWQHWIAGGCYSTMSLKCCFSKYCKHSYYRYLYSKTYVNQLTTFVMNWPCFKLSSPMKLLHFYTGSHVTVWSRSYSVTKGLWCTLLP